MDPAIQHPRARAERGPDREVARQEQPDEGPGARPPADDAGEDEHERHARRQHHRDDHQDPACREQADLDRQTDRAVEAGSARASVVVQVATPRRRRDIGLPSFPAPRRRAPSP